MGRKKGKISALHGSRIEDYALIGDCRTGALVSRAGSIDWLCWPNFASGACFAALLGTKDHGHWQIAPEQAIQSSTRRYQPGTMVLETEVKTAAGEVLLTDFMPLQDDGTGTNPSRIVRVVTGVRGKVPMKMKLTIRFDYGRTVPWVSNAAQELHAVAGPDAVMLQMSCSTGVIAALEGEELSTVSRFTVGEGEWVAMVLTNGSSVQEVPELTDAAESLRSTMEYWRGWAARSTYKGEYAEAVARSLMTLKALTFQPSGGIVAALTTSLPEQIGGERNWDYRYCWLRDTSFTLLVLMHAGYTDEAIAWRRCCCER